MIIITTATVIGLTGCKTPVLNQETTSGNEGTDRETTGQTTEATAAAESTAEAVNPEEIKGNINILTGFEISDTVLNGRPVAVMIENQPDARPQSGLTSADTVFEVVDEGGVTRFVAFYSSKHPDLVGPVRSTRPYYAEYSAGFDPDLCFLGPPLHILILSLKDGH